MTADASTVSAAAQAMTTRTVSSIGLVATPDSQRASPMVVDNPDVVAEAANQEDEGK